MSRNRRMMYGPTVRKKKGGRLSRKPLNSILGTGMVDQSRIECIERDEDARSRELMCAYLFDCVNKLEAGIQSAHLMAQNMRQYYAVWLLWLINGIHMNPGSMESTGGVRAI